MLLIKKTYCYILLVLLCSNNICAQIPARDYQVKAVFLFNFTQYVDWPPASFTSDEAPIIIGVLGTDPFGSYLKETLVNEKINGHPLIAKYYTTVEEIELCHILYINPPAKRTLHTMLEKLKTRSILTVSDNPDFLLEGGMIRFFTKDNKIKLEVNIDAAKDAGLVISSKLLRLADIFNPKS